MSPRARHALALAAILCAGACADPTDTIYVPDPVTGVELAPGFFQVTFDPNPDQVRGFTATGDTILFRSLRLYGGVNQWEMLGIPAGGGRGAVEHAQLYRVALRQALGTLLSRTEDRILTSWLPGNGGDFYGPAGCPRERLLLTWMITFIQLPSRDGVALSSLPTRAFVTPTVAQVGSVSPTFTVRFTPAEIEAEQGANAFGPAMALAATLGFYSDGDVTWRFDPAHAATPADSVGPGIFPAVSADGALLARAVPQVSDSTTATEIITNGLGTCTQKEVSYTVVQVTTVVTRIATGDTVLKVDGTEPVFDPAGGRVLVRRSTGLVWVDLASKAETKVDNTAGAFAVAISPSGQYVAFSKTVNKNTRNENTDVYFVTLK